VARPRLAPGAEIPPLEAPWSAWPSAYQDRLDRLDRLASKIKLNFVTIGYSGPENRSPLRGPKLPHGYLLLPCLFAPSVSLPCRYVGVPLIIARFAASPPSKKPSSPPEKNSPRIFNTLQAFLYK